MNNPGEMRADQHPNTSSVFAFDQYPGTSNPFQLSPNILPTRLNSSNACSNPQFQNISPFGTPYQNSHASIQSNFSTVPNSQNPQQTTFPQFDPQNSQQNNLFNTLTNIPQSPQFNYSNITFNTSLNVPKFDPSKEASWQWLPAFEKGDGLVQFPFTDGGEFGTKPRRPGAKRRTDLADLENVNLPPSKQHITEEKMAEHMSRLHISSETAPTSTIESESVKNKRLYMCEEMRKLQTDPILPPCLLKQRPCTALVLWQPPSKVLNILGPNNNNNEENRKENNNRNVMDDEDFDVVLNNMEMDV